MHDETVDFSGIAVDWEDIPEIESAHADFASCGQHVLDFGEIIINLGAQNFCGPFMIHRHYEILKNEYLIRSYGISQFEVRPIAWHSGLVPCAYKFVNIDGECKFVPFEYIDANLAPIEAIQECKKLNAIMPDVNCLVTNLQIEARNVLGIMILHPEPDSNREMIWLEESDETARVSVTRSVLRSMYTAEERAHFIQTSWIFKNGKTPTVGRSCEGGTKYKVNCLQRRPIN